MFNPETTTLYGKCQAIPLQAWTDPEGSRRFRLPDFKTVSIGRSKFVSPTYRPPLPSQEIFLVLISVRRWVDLTSIERPEDIFSWKFPVTPSGIEPATFKLIAQCHKQLRHRVPCFRKSVFKFIVSLNAFTSTWCIEIGSMWKIKGLCSAPISVLEYLPVFSVRFFAFMVVRV